MLVNILDTWLEKLGQAWEKLDAQAATALFAENVEYFESSLEPAHHGLAEVATLWQHIAQNQKDVTFSHEILLAQDNEGICNWHVTRTKIPSGEHEIINGIFHIKLNDQGLCTYFNQWRTSKIT